MKNLLILYASLITLAYIGMCASVLRDKTTKTKSPESRSGNDRLQS